jgi:hypothetical protein
MYMTRVVLPVDSSSQTRGINIYALNLLLLLSLLSCNQIALASENDLRIDVNVGAIITIKGEDSTLWLGTSDGLFRWDDTQVGLPQKIDVDTGNVSILLQDNDTLWIGSQKGLFRWSSPKQGLPRYIQVDTGPVDKLYKFGASLLIGAKNGLFIWHNPDIGIPTRLDLEVSHVAAFYQDHNVLWIGTKNGLLRWDSGNDKEPVFMPEVKSVEVTSLCKDDSMLLIGTTKGLLRWNNMGVNGPDEVISGSEISSLHKDEYTLSIGVVWKGLFRWDNVREGQPQLVDKEIRYSSKYYRHGSILWIGAEVADEAGLFRWISQKDDKPQRITSVNTGFIHDFHRSYDTLWIGASKGLFRIKGLDTKWDAKLQITSKLPDIIYTDHSVLIRWRVNNFEGRTTPEEVQYRVIIEDSDKREVQLEGEEISGRQEFNVPPLPEGKYSLHVQATDLNGNTIKSHHIELQVNSSLKDIILNWSKILGLIYVLLNILAFIFLLILSRWYRWAFEIFTATWVRRVSIYFGIVLCHISKIRIWVFERYYKELKKEFSEDRPYVTKEIETPDSVLIHPADLLGQIRNAPHILILGDAGTGKTELLKRVLKIYCSFPTLKDAYRQYGFIPIMIPLREFGDPAESGNDSTIQNLAQAALRGMGMWFTDKDFFERLLRRKDFLIILDGLNEVNIDRQVDKFIATSPAVRLLITSQTSLLQSGSQIYRLSPVTPNFAKDLLSAFLGNELAATVFAATAKDFWDDIKSGYDVRLVQNLVTAGCHLPANRLELYAATLNYALTQFSGEYPRYVIYRVAWNMWREKKRRFAPNEELTDVLIKPLLDAKVIIARGSQFEFRHDLMRGYLAACWLAWEASSVAVTKDRLNEPDVWDLSPSEQNLVFPFLAELISAQEALQQVAQFAADEVVRRTHLLVACQVVAANKGWPISVNLNVVPNGQSLSP